MSETKNIYQRLNAVRKEVAYLQKDAIVQGQYKAVSHDLVTSAAREHLIANGVMIVPRQAGAGDCVIVGETKTGSQIIRYQAFYEIDFVNCDQPEDRATVSLAAHANDHGDKAPGKACSYAVKYAMLKLFSIETGDDEESRVEVSKRSNPIDDDQIQAVEDRIKQVSANRDKFLHYFNVREVHDIPSGSYESVMAALNKKEANDKAEAENATG